MITIERLGFDDLMGLKHLYEDAFEGSTTDYDKMLETYKAVNDDPNHVVLCAKEEDKVIGSVLGVVCAEYFGNCKPFMVLEDVAVLKSKRRLGIGKLLLNEIEKVARSRNCSMILFVSSIHRKGAHRLYESLGFANDQVNGYRKRLV